jgi:hypothetical protein
MSSPCELIIVWCSCGALYRDSYRASMNLSMDNFDDDYIQRMSSTTCPNCGLYSDLGTLLARFENDHLSLELKAVPEPLPIVFYPERPSRNHAGTFARIKERVTQEGRTGIEQLLNLIKARNEVHRNEYEPDPLSDIVFDWLVETKCEELELWDRFEANAW